MKKQPKFRQSFDGCYNYKKLKDEGLVEEELQEQIITQIEVLVEELGGTMSHLTKCDYTGRSSKVLQIEYDIQND